MSKAPIPTIDVLPPMPDRVRDALYGILAWLALLLTLAFIALGVAPDTDVPTWLTILSAVVNGAWTLLGFKAKANVPAS